MLKALRHLPLFVLILFSATTIAAPSDPRENERALYQQARKALKSGKLGEATQLQQQLAQYPLLPYLEYYIGRKTIKSLSHDEAVRLMASLNETPLQVRFRHKYLLQLGKSERWETFLSTSPSEPKNEALRCYFFRAHLTQGNESLAWQGAEDLWHHGSSRDKACDPLFMAWEQANQRTDDHIWQRMLLTYKAGNGPLLNYLNRQLSQKSRQRGDKLVSLYRRPDSLASHSPNELFNSDSAQIISLTLKRLARRNVDAAWAQLYSWQGQLEEYRPETTQFILSRMIRTDAWTPSQDRLLARYPEDGLIEQRLRRAIFEADWFGVLVWTEKLTPKKSESVEWRYWQGYALKQQGKHEQAETIWSGLKDKRHFYGFLVAQSLGKPPTLIPQIPEAETEIEPKLEANPTWQRLTELMAVNDTSAARREWRYLMQSLPKADQIAVTALANELEWHFLAIDGTIITKLWDALPWRFPSAHQKEFQQFADLRDLDIALLQAIARRESALYPRARSHANAFGLMQLLPRTARETAQKIGATYRGPSDLYQPKRNIQLGSAYYQQLYQRFDQNRLLASAAYNAGPHRVTRWLSKSQGQLDAPRFIATVPFKETRDYIKAILSYQLIYAWLDDREIPLMTESEQRRSY